MKYIDQALRRTDFNEYTVKFLTDELRADGKFRINLADKKCYSRFSKRDYKKGEAFADTGKTGWLNVLLDEQNHHCCYCMRRLGNDEVSVEHVVPEKFDNQDENTEYAFYAGKACCINDFVELGSLVAQRTFANSAAVAAMTRFPHLVAHSNMTAACTDEKRDGNEIGCCCNNHRGNARILPLMLMADVEQNVEYSDDGTLQVLYPNTDNIVAETIARLNINNDTLKEVRYLWRLISQTDYSREDLLQMNQMQRIKLFKQMFGVQAFAVINLNYQKYADGINSSTNVYWNLLMQYDWFLNYYRNR